MSKRRALYEFALPAAIAAALIASLWCAMAKVPPSKAKEERGVNPSGVTGGELPSSRQGAAQSREALIAGLYDAAAEEIAREVGRAVARLRENPNRAAQFNLQRQRELSAEIERIVGRARGQATRAMHDAVRESIGIGLADAEKQLGDLDVTRLNDTGVLGARFAAPDEDAVAAIADDTLGRLDSAVRAQGAAAASLFRTLSAGPLSGAEPKVNEAIARGLITGNPRAADRALRELLRDPDAPALESYRKIGAKQITVGGWTGPARAYVSTVVRTRTREATVEGRHRRLDAAGVHLVQITGRQSRNFCTRFIGLVCWVSTPVEGYPALADLPGGGPPFHPNCSKGTAAFIPELVSSARSAAADAAARAFETARSNGLLTTDLA